MSLRAAPEADSCQSQSFALGQLSAMRTTKPLNTHAHTQHKTCFVKGCVQQWGLSDNDKNQQGERLATLQNGHGPLAENLGRHLELHAPFINKTCGAKGSVGNFAESNAVCPRPAHN